MTDMLMCLTAHGVRERERDGSNGQTGKKVEIDRERERQRGRNEEKMLMLFNSLLHCHWQRDLHHCSDRCTVMNLALGEIDGVPSSHIPKIVTFCLFFFWSHPFSHAPSYVLFWVLQ